MAKLIDYQCPKCKTWLQARRASLDSLVKCKVCGERIQLHASVGKSTSSSLWGCLLLMALVPVGIAACCLLPAAWIGQGHPQPPNVVQVQSPPAEKPQAPPQDVATEPAIATLVEPATATPQSTAEQPMENVAATPMPRESVEHAAASRLKRAVMLKENFKHAAARELLQQIIRETPATQAATEARMLLEKLSVAE